MCVAPAVRARQDGEDVCATCGAAGLREALLSESALRKFNSTHANALTLDSNTHG